MKYRFGIIFDFGIHLSKCDPMKVFAYVDHRALIEQLVKYILIDPASSGHASDIEALLNDLINDGIVPYHVVFQQNKEYVDLCQLLLSLAESLMDEFMDFPQLFEDESSLDFKHPRVEHRSYDAYLVLFGPY